MAQSPTPGSGANADPPKKKRKRTPTDDQPSSPTTQVAAADKTVTETSAGQGNRGRVIGLVTYGGLLLLVLASSLGWWIFHSDTSPMPLPIVAPSPTSASGEADPNNPFPVIVSLPLAAWKQSNNNQTEEKDGVITMHSQENLYHKVDASRFLLDGEFRTHTTNNKYDWVGGIVVRQRFDAFQGSLSLHANGKIELNHQDTFKKCTLDSWHRISILVHDTTVTFEIDGKPMGTVQVNLTSGNLMLMTAPQGTLDWRNLKLHLPRSDKPANIDVPSSVDSPTVVQPPGPWKTVFDGRLSTDWNLNGVKPTIRNGVLELGSGQRIGLPITSANYEFRGKIMRPISGSGGTFTARQTQLAPTPGRAKARLEIRDNGILRMYDNALAVDQTPPQMLPEHTWVPFLLRLETAHQTLELNGQPVLVGPTPTYAFSQMLVLSGPLQLKELAVRELDPNTNDVWINTRLIHPPSDQPQLMPLLRGDLRGWIYVQPPETTFAQMVFDGNGKVLHPLGLADAELVGMVRFTPYTDNADAVIGSIQLQAGNLEGIGGDRIVLDFLGDGRLCLSATHLVQPLVSAKGLLQPHRFSVLRIALAAGHTRVSIDGKEIFSAVTGAPLPGGLILAGGNGMWHLHHLSLRQLDANGQAVNGDQLKMWPFALTIQGAALSPDKQPVPLPIDAIMPPPPRSGVPHRKAPTP